MASAAPQPHSAFPTRPYSSTLHGKLPERNAPGIFGASSTRETARLERERQERERAHREAQATTQAAVQGGAGPSNPLNSITDEQREEINEAFGLFDLDKDQRIDYHEFKVALKALGFDLPKPEILDLLRQYGTSPDTAAQQPPTSSRHPHQAQPSQQPANPGRLHLTLQAFQTIAASLIAQRDPRDEILRAFALFDTEDKGIISIEDLRRVARELGEGLEEDELVAMIEEFDLEGKGGVGREEFIGICMG
ncbi:EF-hand protein [Venustampulla echinocandica]|uniref:Calmodulin n=1 Tax=Venustampulla echinocandica TaxID=2656787 RepID=A0A370TVN1_9HELO|nr:EF-hand protein [Venustampulla echinocandica]RDL39582.1 EF-hand protein [Venustampulla echinocandica]